MSTAATGNLFPALDETTEAALRESILRFGVLVPVAKDQHGNILDGHHRSKIADDLGVSYRVDVITVADEAESEAIQRTLNTDRRHLSVEQRREVVVTLREQGHSERAIAGAVGVSKTQVHNDLEVVSSDHLDRVKGADGKSYPAKRPSVVAAKNPKEAERAQQALATAPAPAGRVIDVKRAERIAREAEADERRAQPIEPISVDGDIEILHGDFREVLPVASSTFPGAVVITDPPYPREFLGLWADLAEYALGWGCDQLVAMSGQTHLPEVMRAIASAEDPITSDRWNYRWMCSYLTAGPATRVHQVEVGTSWKPVLVYDHGARRFLTTDVFRSTGDDKQHHHWGQNENGIAAIVEAFTEPGDLVVDPFLGGGTTAVVCRALGRRFIGCDVDPLAIDATRERLAA